MTDPYLALHDETAEHAARRAAAVSVVVVSGSSRVARSSQRKPVHLFRVRHRQTEGLPMSRPGPGNTSIMRPTILWNSPEYKAGRSL